MIERQDAFTEFHEVGTTLGDLSREKDLKNQVTLCMLQVFGLLGRYLTGQWMTKFYTAADTEISQDDGINSVKELVETLKQMMQNPLMNPHLLWLTV